MSCPNCGKVNDENATFCVQCGNKLSVEGSNVLSEKKNNNKWIFVIIIGAIILFVIIPGIFIFKFVNNQIKKSMIGLPNRITNIIDKGSSYFKCESDICHTVTIYFDYGDNSSSNNYKSFLVDDGTIIDVYDFIDEINGTFNLNLISSKNGQFKIGIAGIYVDLAFYYKDTEAKFDFNKPITEDVSIVMRVLDSSLDDMGISNFDDLIKKYNGD